MKRTGTLAHYFIQLQADLEWRRIGDVPVSEIIAAAEGLQSLQPRLGTVRIRVNEGINPGTVHNLIDSIAKLTGCPSCGFSGFNLQFFVDLAARNAPRNLPNANSAGFANIVRG